MTTPSPAKNDSVVGKPYRPRSPFYKGASAAAVLALLGSVASAQTIAFWNQGDASVRSFTEEAAAAFEDQTGLSVETQIYPNEAYKTVVQVAMGAGNQPDVFFNWGGEDAFRFVRAGRIKDVTAAASEAGLPDALLTPYRQNDGVWGVPLTQHTVVFYFNKAVFQRHGLTEPRTLSALAETCRVLKDREPDLIPISLGAKEPWTIVHYLTMLFTRTVPADIRAADDAMTAPEDALFTHPGYIEAFRAFRDLQDAGCFNRGINSVNPEEARAFFGAGVAAMTFCGTWCLAPLDQDGMKDGYGLFPMPTIEGAAGDQDAAFIVVEGMQVASATDAPEIADRFLVHMVSPEIQAAMVKKLGRLPVNPAALDEAETTDAFAEAVRLLTSAPRTVMPLDMTLDNTVGQAVYVGGQEFVNRTKTAEEVMASVRRTALRAKARRGV